MVIKGLIFTPPFWPRQHAAGRDDGAGDDQILDALIIGHRLEDAPLHALAATVVSVLTNHVLRLNFRNQAIAGARNAGTLVTNAGQTTIAATQELVRSMSLPLNVSPATYPRLRDGIADNLVPSGSLTGETARVENVAGDHWDGQLVGRHGYNNETRRVSIKFRSGG